MAITVFRGPYSILVFHGPLRKAAGRNLPIYPLIRPKMLRPEIHPHCTSQCRACKLVVFTISPHSTVKRSSSALQKDKNGGFDRTARALSNFPENTVQVPYSSDIHVSKQECSLKRSRTIRPAKY